MSNEDFYTSHDTMWLGIVEIFKLDKVLVWRKNRTYLSKPSLSDARNFSNGVLRDYLSAEAIYGDRLFLNFHLKSIEVTSSFDILED